MIKKSLLLAVFIMTITTSYSQPSVGKLRKAFFAMKTDSCGATTLFKMAKQDNYQLAVVQAYAGAGEAAMAECMSGWLDKLGTFKRGKKNIEEAVEKAAADAEIRFLRFSTQANIPAILGYNNMRDDKQIIIRQLPQLLKEDQEDFWKKAAQFMIDSDELNKEETAAVKNSLEGARL
ncbi:MAG TPA: hypothetical protein VFC92_01045 [Bacteroidales bacterium]|nr:hypothetical protein [Bacteroidales bacterium]